MNAEQLAAEARERVSRVRMKVTDRVPFFGHLLLKLDPVITDRVPLAGVTRDRKLLINPNWACSTSLPELAATLVHETLHCALLCWDRQGSRNVVVTGGDGVPVTLWNISHDYAINLIIRDMSADTVDILDPERWEPKGLIDEGYRGQSAEEIYDALLDKMQQQQQQGQGQPGQQGQQGQQQQQGGGGQQQQGGGMVMPQVQASHGDVQPDDGTGVGTGEGEGDSRSKLSSSQKKEHDQFWKVAIVEAAQVHEQARSKNKHIGALPGVVRKHIEEILDPRVPWTDVLSRWVGENGRRADYTYRRPSRRSESVGQIMPSLQRHGVDDIVVLWDTSGSMDGRETEIFGEIIGIAQDLHLNLRVICCDMMIHSDQSDVEAPEDIDVGGGGGSDFIPAFERLDDEGYQGVVVAFTDGYINVPEVKPTHLRDALWVIWEGDRDPTHGAWGQVLNVDIEGFAR